MLTDDARRLLDEVEALRAAEIQHAQRRRAQAILAAVDDGATNQDIADYYGVSRGRGFQIIREARAVVADEPA